MDQNSTTFYTGQRPPGQAREKDFAKGQRGRRSPWPRLKKARRRRAVVVFGDESGLSLISYRAKTWAPMGKTPVLVHQGRWPKVSAIGGITARGRLDLRVRKGSIRGPQPEF